MRYFLICIACFSFHLCNSQLPDLARLEYSYIPGNNANFQYNRFRALFNVPFKVKEDVYFLVGLDYSDIYFEFNERTDSYEKTNAENFDALALNLTYTFKLKNNWIFGAQVTPSFMSNLEGRLIQEDFRFSGRIAFVKDMKNTSASKKPYRIFIGLFYNNISRFPAPIPFITYYRKFHPKWSYSVGIPYSNIQFHASPKHRIKLHANSDNFNASIQSGVIVNNELPANRLRMMLLLAGLRYEFKFANYFESYINVTRTFVSGIQLRDDRENVFEPNLDGVIHYRMGVRIKI